MILSILIPSIPERSSKLNILLDNLQFQIDEVYKTHPTLGEVEILIDNIDWKFACEKEKEFIKLYGRKDLKKGTLVNLTDGGDGVYGLKFSNESKNKMSIAQKNKKPITEETRYRMSLASKSRDVGSYRRGKKLTDEHKAILLKAIKGVPKPKTQCPHCKLIGGLPQLKQWHFDKCKLK